MLKCSFCVEQLVVKVKRCINSEMSFSHDMFKRLEVRQLRQM